MAESKNEPKAVTTTHVCHWTINITAIIVVAAITLLLCLFWKHIPTIMERLAKTRG